jgi:hypothetical protein
LKRALEAKKKAMQEIGEKANGKPERRPSANS